MTTLFELHVDLCTEARLLMEKKNHDYTSGSGDSLANFRGASMLGINPVIGIQLRQQDKMMRIKTFVEKGDLKVKGESVRDAIIDQINYLVLQYAYIKEQQEEESNDDKRKDVPADRVPTGYSEVTLQPVVRPPWAKGDMARDSGPIHGQCGNPGAPQRSICF